MNQQHLLACPLCQHSSQIFHKTTPITTRKTSNKSFLSCNHCKLVFLAKENRLNLIQERAQYDLHQNQVNDPNYRNFLNRIFEPVTSQISAPAKVLDYGCGPGPALAAMFEESGYQASIYDPYYFPDTSPFDKQYQIITLTEVIEHCHEPLAVLKKVKSLLEPNGIIGIMTKRLTDQEKFATWHYKNDPTHVCFFSIATFQWIAQELGMELEICGDDSVLLKNDVF